MNNNISTSQSDWLQQRKILRGKRRIRLLQSAWRTLIASSLLGSLVWATTRPQSVLSQSSQVKIEGNHLMSKQAIQSLLPLHYPLSLLQTEPQAIARSLESQPPIADATVNRKLFPPGLIVQIQERVPVAVAIAKLPQGNSTATPKIIKGFLDANGVWIPIESYSPTVSRQFLTSLNLKVVGLPEQYRSYWTQMYQIISRSPVKILEIDCQDPTNLIFKTEVGIVHLGPYTPKLTKQLQVLDQLRKLPAKINSSKIAYIDLKNTETPLLQMNQNPK